MIEHRRTTDKTVAKEVAKELVRRHAELVRDAREEKDKNSKAG